MAWMDVLTTQIHNASATASVEAFEKKKMKNNEDVICCVFYYLIETIKLDQIGLLDEYHIVLWNLKENIDFHVRYTFICGWGLFVAQWFHKNTLLNA